MELETRYAKACLSTPPFHFQMSKNNNYVDITSSSSILHVNEGKFVMMTTCYFNIPVDLLVKLVSMTCQSKVRPSSEHLLLLYL